MAAEAPRNLRDDLQALRIDRGTSTSRPPSRRPLGGWIVGLALIVAIALGLVAWWLRSSPREVTVAYASRVEAGGRAPVAQVLSGSGYVVTADKYISVGTRIPGRIEKFFVEESDRVKAGDPLVQLDDRDYRAALESMRARLEVVRANAQLHRLDADRKAKLRAENYASQADLDQANTLLRVDRAQIAQLEAEIAQSQVNLDYTVLRAPTDGVILAKLKEVGEIAVPGGFAGSGELIRMANLNELRAEVDISETDLARISLGQKAQVVPDAYPDKTYSAKLVKLYPQVNRQKGTLKVEVSLESPDEALLPDMSVRVHFLGNERPAESGGSALVLVPGSSVRNDANGTYAWVVSGGRLRRQALRTGTTRGEQVDVVEGLSGGEALVVGDAPDLREGQRIEAR